jgi:hypothetical protein
MAQPAGTGVVVDLTEDSDCCDDLPSFTLAKSNETGKSPNFPNSNIVPLISFVLRSTFLAPSLLSPHLRQSSKQRNVCGLLLRRSLQVLLQVRQIFVQSPPVLSEIRTSAYLSAMRVIHYVPSIQSVHHRIPWYQSTLLRFRIRKKKNTCCSGT